MGGAFPSKSERGSRSPFLGKEQPDLHTFGMNRRFILSADRKREKEGEEQEEQEEETDTQGERDPG